MHSFYLSDYYAQTFATRKISILAIINKIHSLTLVHAALLIYSQSFICDVATPFVELPTLLGKFLWGSFRASVEGVIERPDWSGSSFSTISDLAPEVSV